MIPMAPALPIDPALPQLVAALRLSNAAILTAPPGSGKSTRVPGALLDSGLLGGGSLVMLEPRRLAARAIAGTIAALRGGELGGEVGYQVRFERRASAATRLLVVTEGILTRRLVADPLLDGVSCVVLDEFHERSVHADLALAFLKELSAARPEFKLVIMSATLDAEAVSRYLGGAPVISAEGRPFPVEVEHVPDRDDRPLAARVAGGVTAALRRVREGDVLAFLPGAGEIRAVADRLREPLGAAGVDVAALHGALGAREQDAALNPGARRRVVLATNIAETSLTIPGVTAVVDSGLAKRSRWDSRVGLDGLELGSVSRASAEQRAGRAGRVAPGHALRLWTRAEHAALRELEEPEIRRVDPAPLLLSVLAFRPGDPREFDFFERPRDAAIAAGIRLLDQLGAVEAGGRSLTALGRALADLPVHPRLGVILLDAARSGGLDRAARFAALLGDRDVLDRARAERERLADEDASCDLELRAELVARFETDGATREAAAMLGLGFGAATAALEAKRQLLGSPLPRRSPAGDRASGEGGVGARLLLPGFPDRVCRRRAPGAAEAVMVGGHGVRLSTRSAVRSAELFLAVFADRKVRGERATAEVSIASAVSRGDLEAAFPQHMRVERAAVFDASLELVRAVRRTYFMDLLLDERREERPDRDTAAAILAEAAMARFDDVFAPDAEARALVDRLLFAARALPEETWPDAAPEALARRLPALCDGLSGFAEVRRIDWTGALRAELGRLARALDDEIPDRLSVPSGSRIRIDYAAAAAGKGPPVLAARIQELFGMRSAPLVARGRVALAVHLLAPNGRPAQVTTDLESFWKSTYPQVRKELRARYPRHDWPDDPLTAAATSRAKKRK
jgi:ATP-dependent helicase HrpB